MFSVFCSLFYKRTFFMRTFLWEHFFLFSILENSEHFPKQRTFFSEMFSFFTENKISWEQLMKCSQKYFSLDCSLNLWLQKLPKTSKNFQKLPKTSQDFPKLPLRQTPSNSASNSDFSISENVLRILILFSWRTFPKCSHVEG